MKSKPILKMYTTEVFILSEQPTTCPKCGARTEIIIDMSHTIHGSQVEECLGCGFQFVIQTDEKFHSH
jgi:predicted RNA-binding Zn-ribbon protein involved in translation (DUF1610 family)